MLEVVAKTTFGHVLVARRIEVGLTQGDLSRWVGISQATISQLEKGKTPLTRKSAARLPKALGGTTALWLEIFEGTETGSTQSVEHFLQMFGDRSKSDVGHFKEGSISGGRIIELFSSGENGIENFDEISVGDFNYYARLGEIVPVRKLEGLLPIEIEDGTLELEAGKTIVVQTLELFNLESRYRAEVRSYGDLEVFGCRMVFGRWIDSDNEGHLKIRLINETNESLSLEVGAPILTVRIFEVS